MRKKISLKYCALESVTGRGPLTFKVNGSREYKGGRLEEVTVEFEVCRGAIFRLLEEVKKVHGRDADEIASIQQRVVREKGILW